MSVPLNIRLQKRSSLGNEIARNSWWSSRAKALATKSDFADLEVA